MAFKFESDMARFWHKPNTIEGATESELNEAETKIGFKLPPELRQLLAIRDGGVPNFYLFGEILVPPFRGVTNKGGTGHLADLYLKGGVRYLPRSVVIFANDADAWFALDYRTNNSNPSVLHWSEYEASPVEIAPTFRAFLSQLSDS